MSLELHAMTTLRSDADCWFLYTGPHPKRKGARRKDDGKVNGQDLRRFDALGTVAEATHGQESRASASIIPLLAPDRHRELHDGAVGHIGGRPEPAAVRFDNPAADRQPQAQPLRLGRIEGVEQP